MVATNKARRARLVAIARDRLGYQEYVDNRDSIDRNITTAYARLQRKDGTGAGGRKKKKDKEKEREKSQLDGGAGSEIGNGNGSAGGNGSGNGNGNGTVEVPPAARGLGPDEQNRLVVSEQLRKLVETRREWVDMVGVVFDEKQKACPGRQWGFPPESVYAGVEEEVREVLDGGGFAVGQWEGEGGEGGLGIRTNGASVTPRNNGKGKERATGDEMDVG